MLLDAPTFVVQRRINRPLTDVQRGLSDRRALVPAAPLDPVSEGFMHLHEPLRPVAPFSSRQPAPSWCARAYLLTARSTDAFIPHLVEPGNMDYRNLGAQMRFWMPPDDGR